MGVCGLPWTPAVKIWQFDLTQDHLDPEGIEGHFVFFVPNPYNMGVMDSPGPQQSRFGHLT